jgi:hypothetical protein
MAKPYSEDLRGRVVGAGQDGATIPETAVNEALAQRHTRPVARRINELLPWQWCGLHRQAA